MSFAKHVPIGTLTIIERSIESMERQYTEDSERLMLMQQTMISRRNRIDDIVRFLEEFKKDM